MLDSQIGFSSNPSEAMLLSLSRNIKEPVSTHYRALEDWNDLIKVDYLI